MNNLYCGVEHGERMKRAAATDIARRIAIKRSHISHVTLRVDVVL